MKAWNPAPTRTLLLVFGMIASFSVDARADLVPLTAFSAAYGTSNSPFSGFAYDQTTKTYYSHNGYGSPASQPVMSYDSTAAFATGTASGSMTIPNAADQNFGSISPPAGTYFVVNNGALYGRTDASSNILGKWDAATGTLLGTATMTGIGGANGPDTFNWGGFSGLDLYNDNGLLYMLGKNTAGTQWEILSLAPDLSVTRTLLTTLPSTLGYAFVINGELFAGTNFNSNQISYKVDLATGAQSAVNFTFTGDSGGPYLSDMFYDRTSDSLFVYDTGTKTLYETSNASVTFDAPAQSPVPEPGSILLLLTVVAGVALAGKRVYRHR